MLRARGDMALEVIVNGRLVGWLTNYCNVPDDCREIVLKRVQVDATFGDIVEHRSMRLFRWNFSANAQDLASRSPRWIQSHVPNYASPIWSARLDQSLYTWRVLKLTPDEYEWVFDLPDFEPADTKVDLDQVLEMSPEERLGQMVAQRLGRDMANAITRGMTNAFTGGLANFTSATNAVAQSANESVLTLEKLDAMLKSVRMTGR